jgi:hypothetical protein
MRQTAAVLSGILILAAIGAYAVGQQQSTERSSAASFAVAPMGDTAVLLDTRTGQAWLLSHSVDKDNPSAWLPTIRIDGADEAAKWRAMDQGRARLTKLNAEYSRLKAMTKSPEASPQFRMLEKQIADLEAKLNESK